MNTVKDIPVNPGVLFAQTADQEFDFLALAAARFLIGEVFGEAAGTLDKMQTVIANPGENRVFMDTVKRSDQRHALKVGAVQLWKHSMQLGSIKHPHQGRLNHIAQMVTERYFIAAELLRVAVKESSAHSGTEIAG